MIAPNTDIILYKTPIELDNLNQLKFDNFNAQWAWFSSLPRLFLDDATFQRKDGVIRFPTNDQITYDDLIQYNYCTYKNENYGPKVFFAFIKDIRYINDGMCEIELKLDAWQTWQNDIEYKRSFVEREHVSNDSIGAHTIPEGLETGEYISYGEPYVIDCMDMGAAGNTTHCLCMGITGARGCLINNQYSGLEYVFFKDISTEGEAWALMNTFIDRALEGNDEVIQFIMPIPLSMVDTDVDWTNVIPEAGFHYGTFKIQGAQVRKYTAWDLGTFVKVWDNKLGGGYTPRNKKLLCYPYRYLMLTNNVGGNMIYRFEEETYSQNKDRLAIQVSASLVPGLSVIAVPQYYKGVEENYSESLMGAKVPLCSWSSDMYTNWLVQNGVNEDLAKTVTYEDAKMNYNLSQVPVVGGIAHTYGGIFNSMAEVWQHRMVPYGSRGVNGGDVNYSLNNLNFKLYDFVIKREYAQIIDQYFDMYGYKVNTVKVPNIHSRRNWNYIKTIGLNIIGNIPQEDLQEIKSLFDNGITLWHNPKTFLDYSQSNYII